jgi:hypothetical protein
MLDLTTPTRLLAAQPSLLQQLQSSALSGDLGPVDRMIANLDADSLDALSIELLDQYRVRFSMPQITNAPDSTTSLVNAVIGIYEDYWRSALTRKLTPEVADKYLQQALRSLLNERYPEYDESGDVFSQLAAALAAAQVESSVSITPPWRDLYIWSRQNAQDYQVELTDGVEQVTVIFMEQAVVQGWQHFALLDLLATSGWATATALYCLCWSYDLESDAFRKSWLKHETRHLADFREFPGLAESDMEYRAKLTELAFAGSDAVSMLQRFAISGSAISGFAVSESAHTTANHRVSDEIYRQIFQQQMPDRPENWPFLSPARVSEVARYLLQVDTGKLKRVALSGQ